MSKERIVSPNGELPLLDSRQKELPSGRYWGYVKIADHDVSYPLALDLIAYGQTRSHLKLKAVVKIMHGDFGSFEYLAQYFPQVEYDYEKKSLSFNLLSNDDELTFRLEDVYKDNQLIRGWLKVPGRKTKGEFTVQWQKNGTNSLVKEEAPLDRPVQRLLTGTYEGTCQNNKPAWLQVEALPISQSSRAGIEKSWNITARLALGESSFCLPRARACVVKDFSEGRWDFLKRQLVLVGKRTSLACQFLGDKVQCDDCAFKKAHKSNWADKLAQFKYHSNSQKSLVKQNQRSVKRAPPVAKLAGVYYGYVHHEQQGRYQWLKLQLESQKSKQKTPLFKAVASLYFGKMEQQEYIAYRFLPRKFSRTKPLMVFDGPGESFLVVTSWQENAMGGVWYSKTFGRIGQVELLKNQIPSFAKPMKLVNDLSGVYLGGDWSLSLHARANVSEKPKDYFPITFYGFAKPQLRQGHRYNFLGGTYDFYKGLFSLRLQQGSSFFGQFDDDNVRIYRSPMPKGTSLHQVYEREIVFTKHLLEPRAQAEGQRPIEPPLTKRRPDTGDGKLKTSF